jgi:hypothetical protein
MAGRFYQAEAHHICDYQLWRLDGSDEMFRGPAMVLRPGAFVSYVGAAQTFGTFARHPFPSLVTERVGGAAANLGIGGAGPYRFLGDARLISMINQSRVAVVQVMSGRSAPNRLLENLDGCSSVRRRDSPTDRWVWAEHVWAELFETLPRPELESLIDETRDNWLAGMRELLQRIEVPTILLWISIRAPDYPFGFGSVQQALGPFPHFVNAAMLEELIPHADAFVDATSARGAPQPLFDRFTGEHTWVDRPDYSKMRHNNGYPTPEMHVDIAEALAPVLREFVGAP